MYKLTIFNGKTQCANKIEPHLLTSIPFAPDNTDYAKFKLDISEGAELLDADGNTMTAEQVAEFLKTLP